MDWENGFAVSEREVIDIKMRQKTDVFFLSYFWRNYGIIFSGGFKSMKENRELRLTITNTFLKIVSAFVNYVQIE